MKFDDIIAYEHRDQIRDDIMELLGEYGEIPEVVREKLENTWSMNVLKQWLKLSAKVSSIEEFINKM